MFYIFTPILYIFSLKWHISNASVDVSNDNCHIGNAMFQILSPTYLIIIVLPKFSCYGISFHARMLTLETSVLAWRVRVVMKRLISALACCSWHIAVKMLT
jgi:hypothetical protein